MINIDGYLAIIESASKGEQVRDAIIDVFSALDATSRDATYLGGHDAYYYGTKQDVNRILNRIGEVS